MCVAAAFSRRRRSSQQCCCLLRRGRSRERDRTCAQISRVRELLAPAGQREAATTGLLGKRARPSAPTGDRLRNKTVRADYRSIKHWQRVLAERAVYARRQIPVRLVSSRSGASDTSLPVVALSSPLFSARSVKRAVRQRTERETRRPTERNRDKQLPRNGISRPRCEIRRVLG